MNIKNMEDYFYENIVIDGKKNITVTTSSQDEKDIDLSTISNSDIKKVGKTRTITSSHDIILLLDNNKKYNLNICSVKGNILISNFSGVNISIDNGIAQKMRLTSIHGEILNNGIATSDELQIRNTHGSIYAKNLTSNVAKIYNVHSNIVLKNVYFETSDIENVHKDIEIEAIEGSTINIHSHSAHSKKSITHIKRK